MKPSLLARVIDTMKEFVLLTLVFLLAICIMGAASQFVFGVFPVYPTHVQFSSILAGSTGNPSSAPSYTFVDTSGGYLFTHALKETQRAGLAWAVADTCVVSGEDQSVQVQWSSEDGDALADGETVVFTLCYRTFTGPGDVLDTGTEQCQSGTYTQSGAGLNKEFHQTSITIPWNTGNQVLLGHAGISGIFHYDDTSTYTGDVHVGGWGIGKTVNSLCTIF